MTEIRVEEPGVWLHDTFWFWRREGFDVDQICEQVLERRPHICIGDIPRTGGEHIGLMYFQKRINEGLGQFRRAGESPLNQVGIELTAFAENATSAGVRISFGFQVCGEIIKILAERTAPEVNERAFFFVPIFEHINGSAIFG